jgi:hypothetical protein
VFTWAWVPALGVNAGEGVGALCVDGALGPALGRGTDVALQTDAGGHFVEGPAASIGAAGIVEARVDGPSLRGRNRDYKRFNS